MQKLLTTVRISTKPQDYEIKKGDEKISHHPFLWKTFFSTFRKQPFHGIGDVFPIGFAG